MHRKLETHRRREMLQVQQPAPDGSQGEHIVEFQLCEAHALTTPATP
jgi:hypothetical protein